MSKVANTLREFAMALELSGISYDFAAQVARQIGEEKTDIPTESVEIAGMMLGGAAKLLYSIAEVSTKFGEVSPKGLAAAMEITEKHVVQKYGDQLKKMGMKIS